MKITRETTTDEVLNVLSDHIEQVIAKIPAYPLKVPFYAMTIGDYLKCTMDGQYLWMLVADKMAYNLANIFGSVTFNAIAFAIGVEASKIPSPCTAVGVVFL